MQKLAALGRDNTSIEIDCCMPCHFFWFDGWESTRLSPDAVKGLLTRTHKHDAPEPHPLLETLPCPRCSSPLAITSDRHSRGRFQYFRCPQGHGRFTAFPEFWREKYLLGEVSLQELREFRPDLCLHSCAGCGAGVESEEQTHCAGCRARISEHESQRVGDSLADLKQLGEEPMPEGVAPTTRDEPAEAVPTSEALSFGEALHPRYWSSVNVFWLLIGSIPVVRFVVHAYPSASDPFTYSMGARAVAWFWASYAVSWAVSYFRHRGSVSRQKTWGFICFFGMQLSIGALFETLKDTDFPGIAHGPTLKLFWLTLALLPMGLSAWAVIRQLFERSQSDEADENLDPQIQNLELQNLARDIETTADGCDPSVQEYSTQARRHALMASRRFELAREQVSRSFAPTELAYSRFMSALEQAEQALIASLGRVSRTLLTISVVEASHIHERLQALDARRDAQDPSDIEERSALQERLALFKKLLDSLSSYLTDNEEVFTALDHLLVSLSNASVQARGGTEEIDACLDELEHLRVLAAKFQA